MHRGRRLGRIGAGVLALAVLAGSGAGAARPPAQLDLSTPPAVTAELTSLGADPSAAVVQRGLRNYAGPSCPGSGWTCTTATTVVQVAPAGGSNLAECADGCVAVQQGPAA